MPKTTPLPVSRLLHQSALHRIAVQIPQLHRELVRIAYVAIMVAFLPEGTCFLRAQVRPTEGRTWGTREGRGICAILGIVVTFVYQTAFSSASSSLPKSKLREPGPVSGAAGSMLDGCGEGL